RASPSRSIGRRSRRCGRRWSSPSSAGQSTRGVAVPAHRGGEMNRRTWILTAAVLIPVVAAGCASMRKMKPEEAIAARQKLMKAQGEAWKNIQDKTKAGDVAGVVPEAQKLVDTSAQIPALFPEGSVGPPK